MLVISSLLILNANAEPIPYPTEPNKQRPTLKIETPQSGEFYATNSIEVAFSVTIPQSWNIYNLRDTPGVLGNYTPVIGRYTSSVFLDGVHQENHQTNFYWFPTPDVLTANYSIVLEGLERGTHSVIIEVESATFYDNPNPDIDTYSDFTYELETFSKTIPFRITSYLPSPSPTPTPKYPMGYPEQRPTPFEITIIAVIAVIGIGLLVYFKKYKRK